MKGLQLRLHFTTTKIKKKIVKKVVKRSKEISDHFQATLLGDELMKILSKDGAVSFTVNFL